MTCQKIKGDYEFPKRTMLDINVFNPFLLNFYVVLSEIPFALNVPILVISTTKTILLLNIKMLQKTLFLFLIYLFLKLSNVVIRGV